MSTFVYEEKLLHELFQLQAKRTPERIAIIDGPPGQLVRQLTYAELDAQTDTLALWLRSQVSGRCRNSMHSTHGASRSALCSISDAPVSPATFPFLSIPGRERGQHRPYIHEPLSGVQYQLHRHPQGWWRLSTPRSGVSTRDDAASAG